eukprot:scaffold12203_cov99-Isochrysis_galbana.AAC.1
MSADRRRFQNDLLPVPHAHRPSTYRVYTPRILHSSNRPCVRRGGRHLHRDLSGISVCRSAYTPGLFTLTLPAPARAPPSHVTRDAQARSFFTVTAVHTARRSFWTVCGFMCSFTVTAVHTARRSFWTVRGFMCSFTVTAVHTARRSFWTVRGFMCSFTVTTVHTARRSFWPVRGFMCSFTVTAVHTARRSFWTLLYPHTSLGL